MPHYGVLRSACYRLRASSARRMRLRRAAYVAVRDVVIQMLRRRDTQRRF